MANAERTYVDPSALRSLYVHDDRSARFCRWRRRTAGSLPITRFGRTEIVNSVELAVHRKLIDRDAARGVVGDLDNDIRDGGLTLVDTLWRRSLDLATDLSARHTARLGTRTLDVLHVATAVTLEMTHFVSYDARQVALARAVGLRVLAP
ncbi:MAG: type II toxin-antitoxin system VapC family toxin [Polyangiaceae bacterium]